MINEDSDNIEAPTIHVSGEPATLQHKITRYFKIYKEKAIYLSSRAYDKYKEQNAPTRRLIAFAGVFILVLLLVLLSYGRPTISTKSDNFDVDSIKTSCPHVDLGAKIDGTYVFGRVTERQLILYSHPLEDVNTKPSSSFIYQNGNVQDKFLQGDWWRYDTAATPRFTGGLGFVGLLDNNCLTDVALVPLPLEQECNLEISSRLVKTNVGIELQIQAQAVRKVEYYLFMPKNTNIDIVPTADEIFIKDNLIGVTTGGEPFSKLFANFDTVNTYTLYVGAVEFGCRSVIDALLSTSANSDEDGMPLSSGGAPVSSLSESDTNDNTLEAIAVLLLKQKDDADRRDKEIYKKKVDTLKQNTKHVRPVDILENPGGLNAKNKEGDCDPWFCNIKVRSIYDKVPGVVVIKFMVIGGPVDVYYLVRPENLSIGEPSIQAVMKYGEKAGNFVDERVEVAIKDYVPSVYNVIYIVGITGKCEYGLFKRRFIA